MTTTLLQQALDALETHVPHVYKDRGYAPIENIRSHLAAQPAPVPNPQTLKSDWRLAAAKFLRDEADDQQQTNEQYPRHAAAHPSWVQRVDWALRLAEKLEQLSAASPFGLDCAAPVPARCQYCDDTGDVNTPTGEWRGRCVCKAGRDAAPVPVPLTDEQMWKLWNAQGDDAMDQTAAIKFARAIEAAHGIAASPEVP